MKADKIKVREIGYFYSQICSMEEYKELDSVLAKIGEKGALCPKDISPKLERVTPNTDIIKIRAIFIKLRKDGFIIPSHAKHDELVEKRLDKELDDELQYIITFEGIIYHKLGGYRQEAKDKANLKSLQSVQKWAIVIGTSLSGLYCAGKFLLWLHTHLDLDSIFQ